MAFKLRGTSPNVTKIYLQPIADGAAPGSRVWEYVTADAPATVDGAGYIDATDATTGEDAQLAINMLKIGDTIHVYQVAALDDTRPISEDKAQGITDISVHVVLENDGTVIDLSDELYGGSTVVYGD